MKRIVLAIIAMLSLISCSKESLPNSKWVCSISGQQYCMEFTSDSEVRLFACDQYYNYKEDLQKDNYTKNGNNIEFRGVMHFHISYWTYYVKQAKIVEDIMTVYGVSTKNSEHKLTLMRID